ncbi:ABC transporter permease [Pseudalkalibacillus caeni]|uniref:ABC transporter permease n=2 Tax=Exobacillus caeni TaxID=2574798 RepID=A0A5R9FAT0_9BACL|nr:oligopeptide ABC transporter permease [Pseudalkalibacillus caeni]TLS37983.1 ABC transporter permease [Pseudalkalibacillus caeni]
MRQEQLPDLTDDMFQPADIDSSKNEEIAGESTGFWKDAWRRLRKNLGAIIGIVIIVVLSLLAIFGPMMNEYSYHEQDLMRAKLPAKVPGLENVGFLGLNGVDIRGVDQYEAKGVDEYFWFGTDEFGRDQWTRVWQGTRISLFIALAAAFIDFVIGVAYGGISAFYGGRVDNILQRIIEVLVGIPNLILIILFILIFEPGILSIILALAVTGWIGMARIVRGQVLKLKNQEFVLASRTLGASDGRVIGRHLIPNVLGQIIITTMFTIPNAIFFEAFLSFIGLGIRPPEASLGSIINNGFSSLQIYPHLVLYPSIVISLLMIAFNLVGDGLRDAFDPKLRK